MIELTVAVALSVISGTYAATLLDAMHQRYPDVVAVRITTADSDHHTELIDRRWRGTSRTSDTRALLDANGNEIGAISLSSACTDFSHAGAVSQMLSRRIYSRSALTEPDPFVPGAARAPVAQAMVDDALAQDPSIITLAFHVTPPGGTTNSIVASSFGRIGKAADADDNKVIGNGETLREVTNGGNRIAVELPLRDSRGNVIGALSTSFRVKPGTSEGVVEAKAIALRDELARRTPSLNALFLFPTVSRQVSRLRTCNSRVRRDQ